MDQPAAGPITTANLPGLGKSGRSAWLDPRKESPYPDGLISGCAGDRLPGGITVGCEFGD